MDRRLAAIAGFAVLGLSPSFVDWQQEPEQRFQMVLFYIVGTALIYYGLWDGK
jgi:sulfite exporter TauE/SafE